MPKEVLKILLVDDHRIFRDGIESMFRQSNEVKIAGLASNGAEALERITELDPDVVLLDLSMPGMSGLEFLTEVAKLKHMPEILVLSMHSDIDFVTEALSLGARGYISKEDTDRDELLEAIKAVASGKSYFGKPIRNLMQEQFMTGVNPQKNYAAHEPGPDVLSKRETEILKMVIEGMSNQEIAEASFVSIRTVETHKNNIMTKLSLKNTVELVKYAIRHRFFDL